jgi:hypothetical protein
LPLTAAGNEAYLCVGNMKLTRGELAFGRVRDSAFSIFLTLGAGNLSETDQGPLAQKAEKIARQIAGSLF